VKVENWVGIGQSEGHLDRSNLSGVVAMRLDWRGLERIAK
jgi:hypothetical protein